MEGLTREITREIARHCKRAGCRKPAAPGQVYCSRACAPYGFYPYGSEEERRLAIKRKKQDVWAKKK